MAGHTRSVSDFENYCRTCLQGLGENGAVASASDVSPVIAEMLERLFASFEGQERVEALGALFDIWRDHAHLIVANWARICPNDYALMFDLLDSSDAFVWRARPIKTVAIHMRDLFYGGSETDGVAFANWLAAVTDESGNQRFKVVVITDEELSNNDRALDPRITRHSMPEWKSADVSDEWAQALVATIERHEIDAIIQNMWVKHNHGIWDMLLVKSCSRRPAFIQRLGGSFVNTADLEGRLIDYYRHPDALIALAEYASKIWGAFNPRTFVVPNLSAVSREAHASVAQGDDGGLLTRPSVLWVNRLERCLKRPQEYLRVAKLVAERLPNVRFDIVGDADEPGFRDWLESLVVKLGLQDRVTFHGFQVDPSPYYAKASLLLMTSECEGSPNVLYEAASFALPVVMYDIPELDFNDQFPARRAVAQCDAEAAANEIVGLLTNGDYYAKTRRQMSRDYERFIVSCPQKTASSWGELVGCLETGTVPEEPALGTQDVRRMVYAMQSRRQARIGRGAYQMSKGKVRRLKEALAKRAGFIKTLFARLSHNSSNE